MKRASLCWLFGLLVLGCTDGKEEVNAARGADAFADEAVIRFVDHTERAGLTSFQQVNGGAEKAWITGSIGGGVGFIDHDLDGDLDVYLTNGSRMGKVALEEAPRDALFVHEGNGSGRFVDGTAAAGLGDPHWTSGVRVVDLDGDGWSDLFLTNNGPNAFYRNEQGAFREEAESLGLADASWGGGAAFLDFDRDGDLDLYVANYVDLDMQELYRHKPTQSYRGVEVFFGPRGLPEAPDLFYRQEEDGGFSDVSVETWS